MASKSLPRWNASTSFRFQIDEEFRDSVLDGLSRKELCLDLLVSADDDDDIEYDCSLYPDGMAEGELTFELDGENHVLCKIEGAFELDLTGASAAGGENQKIRDSKAAVTCSGLGDTAGNLHGPASEEGDTGIGHTSSVLA